MVSGEQAIVDQLCKIHDEMKQLRMLSKAVEDRTVDVYFVTIPEEGGSREFAVGITKIDFKTGLITNPDGSIEELSRKLDLIQDKDDMHSISIHSNQNILFRLDSSGQQSVSADFLFQLPYVTYSVVEITCTEISAINIFACTNPQATLGNFKVTTISTIEQESISGDTTETQAWDSVISLKNNLNRIRHQIISITGESWGTVSNSIASLFDTSSGHDHDGTNSKKVDAGDVINTPTGNIAATDAQAAINELDTEKETPAGAQGKVDTHAADTSTHGVAEVVGTSDAQTLTNKTMDGDQNTISNIDIVNLVEVDKQSFTNLLENGDFESWSAGASAVPDGWTNSGLIAFVRENTIKKVGSYSAKLTADSLYNGLISTLPDYTRYRGRTITLGCWIYSDIANDAAIKIVDSVSELSAKHQTVNEYEWVTVTHTVDVNATSLYVKLYPSLTYGNNEAYFDGAILVEGSVCPAFSPKPLAKAEKNMANGVAGLDDNACIIGSLLGVASQEAQHTTKSASATLRNSHDAEVQMGESVWTLQKTITVDNGISGILRIKHDNYNHIAADLTLSQVRKNGVVLGAAHNNSAATTYATYSEDLNVGTMQAGETLELWGYGLPVGAANHKVKNFRLYYDDNPPIAVDTTNATP